MTLKHGASLYEVAMAVNSDDVCGECPVWDSDQGVLYWTDCVGLRFHALHHASSQHDLLSTGVEVYGFRRNRSGGFVVTNTAGVWTWDGAADLRLIAGHVDGCRLQLNDCTADSAGRLLTGSYFYDPTQEFEPGKLVRVERDGRAVVLDDGFSLANGIGLSPDESRLYFTDTAARKIYVYDYRIDTGSVRNRRVLVSVPADQGIPDGLVVDSDGFIWSAQWYGGCVVRYDQDGREERRISVPAKQVSSVVFGGPDLTDLFLTTAGRTEVLPLMPPGYDPVSGFFGGPLYRVALDIRGQATRMADLQIPPSIGNDEH
jgi:sugar lactone lactonase YvrE